MHQEKDPRAEAEIKRAPANFTDDEDDGDIGDADDGGVAKSAIPQQQYHTQESKAAEASHQGQKRSNSHKRRSKKPTAH